jgi:hypothetical protein
MEVTKLNLLTLKPGSLLSLTQKPIIGPLSSQLRRVQFDFTNFPESHLNIIICPLRSFRHKTVVK